MWSWFESVWVQVTLGSCFSFLYRFFTDHENRGRIVLFERLFVCKLGKIRQGLFLVGWTEVNPW